MTIARDRGKRLERSIAKRVGGKRVGVTGIATPDVTMPGFSVECKSRASVPLWINDALDQAATNGDADTTPIVILHQTGWRHERDIVMIRMAAWEEIVGEMRRDQ